MSNEKELTTEKHLRVVNEIAAILNKEFSDHDDIYYLIKTLRNIFIWNEEEDHTEWLFGKALRKFAQTNREFIKSSFNLKDK